MEFARKVAEGQIHIERFRTVRFQLGNIAIFLRALLYSLSNNRELVEFLSNITAGNIREIIEFVKNFIGSANVNAQKIIDIMEREERYIIPIHEFWKAALLGQYSYYHPESSLAFNLFDIRGPDPNEHFLVPMILGYINDPGDHESKEGYVSTSSIVAEMQEWGFGPVVTESGLRRVNNKRLVETPQRVTFEEDESGLYGEMPEYFRINTIGAYHLLRWITEFSYLDAVMYDTPILKKDVRNRIMPLINSFSIVDRLERTLEFRRYLSRVWHSSQLAPRYFNWTLSLAGGEESFRRVQKGIDRMRGR